MSLTESALAGHNGTLVVQNKRSRIFFGPGEAGYEKNCKVNPRTFGFLKDFGGGCPYILCSIFIFSDFSGINFSLRSFHSTSVSLTNDALEHASYRF